MFHGLLAQDARFLLLVTNVHIRDAFQKLWLLVPVLYSFRLYYTAESNLQLGNRGDAIAILNEIIEFYSGTEAAVMAQALIDRSDPSYIGVKRFMLLF